MKAFAQEEARDFDDEYWLLLIHEGSNKKRIECCKDNNESLCYLRVTQGQSGGIPKSPELTNYTFITSFTAEFLGIFNPFWGVE